MHKAGDVHSLHVAKWFCVDLYHQQAGCLHGHASHKPSGSLSTLDTSKSRKTKHVGQKIKDVSLHSLVQLRQKLSTFSGVSWTPPRSRAASSLWSGLFQDLKMQLSLVLEPHGVFKPLPLVICS